MISIAVIGAGPGGLFFCHNVEKLRRQFPDSQIHVTCFERSSQPGGVWKAGSVGTTVDMYAQLWSNGSSHCLEFQDYTFDQHFGRAVPVYLKRQDLLDYILGRVQHNCPDFLEKYVQLQHSVDNVTFDDATQKFVLSVRNMFEDTVTTQHFDKCIWACGENGRRHIPAPLAETFEDFAGPVLHSAEVADIERFTAAVRNKRILLVGGGYSAEDLTLQAIQSGAEHVYICSRSSYSNEVSYTSQWPGNRVTMIPDQVPFLVTGEGRCIQFHWVEWDHDHYKRAAPGVSTKLRDVDTVFLCTGYRKNLDMLEPRLRKDGYPSFEYRVDDTLTVPSDWKMSPSPLASIVGDVPVAEDVSYHTSYVHPRFYRGVLISNPNLMFICQYDSSLPLMTLEAYSSLLAGFATGKIAMPSPEEMKRKNEEEALRLLKFPTYRYHMDRNYSKAVNEVWPEEDRFPEYDLAESDEWVNNILSISTIFQESGYPLSFGTYSDGLNEMGRQIESMGWEEYYDRKNLASTNPDDMAWVTFRDVKDTSRFRSLFTGTAAVPLEAPWMRLQEDALEKENGRSSPRSVDDPPPLLA